MTWAKLLKVKQDMQMLEENKKTRKLSTLYISAYIKKILAEGEERKKTEENQMKGRRR